MGGLDAVVFTGGIGENSPSMRRRICDGLDFMGLQLDHDRNQAVKLASYAAPQIQAYGSRVRVLVTETAEQLMIARETATALERKSRFVGNDPRRGVGPPRSPFAGGGGYAVRGWIRTRPGDPASPAWPLGSQGAASRLRDRKAALERVAILGPLRPRTQIEVSRTDSFALGIDVPVRDSGKLDGTPTITIVGPCRRFHHRRADHRGTPYPCQS